MHRYKKDSVLSVKGGVLKKTDIRMTALSKGPKPKLSAYEKKQLDEYAVTTSKGASATPNRHFR